MNQPSSSNQPPKEDHFQSVSRTNRQKTDSLDSNANKTSTLIDAASSSLEVLVNRLIQYHESLTKDQGVFAHLANECHDEWRSEEKRVSSEVLDPILEQTRPWLEGEMNTGEHLKSDRFNTERHHAAIGEVTTLCARANQQREVISDGVQRIRANAERTLERTRDSCTLSGRSK